MLLPIHYFTADFFLLFCRLLYVYIQQASIGKTTTHINIHQYGFSRILTVELSVFVKQELFCRKEFYGKKANISLSC